MKRREDMKEDETENKKGNKRITGCVYCTQLSQHNFFLSPFHGDDDDDDDARCE